MRETLRSTDNKLLPTEGDETILKTEEGDLYIIKTGNQFTSRVKRVLSGVIGSRNSPKFATND